MTPAHRVDSHAPPDLSAAPLRSGHVRMLLCALATLTAPLGGCAKRAPGGETQSAEPSADIAAAGIDVIEAELSAREGQLRAAGIPLRGAMQTAEGEPAIGRAEDVRDQQVAEKQVTTAGTPTSAPASPGDAGAGPSRRCETICDLATSICDLRDNICALAPRHPDEPRYQLACDRAGQDCSLASEACHACS